MTDQAGSRLQLINAISALTAAVLIPVIIAVLGHRYTTALKEREIQSRFVELALTVLKESPRAESRAIREWALDVVDKYSGVQLDSAARDQLANEIAFPGPATDISRIFLLAGNASKGLKLDSLRSALLRSGHNVVGQNAALVDAGRPATPEVRYFNTSDKAEAESVADRLRELLRESNVIARYYRDSSARPGYIEIWLGR